VSEVTSSAAALVGLPSQRETRSRIHRLHFVIQQASRNVLGVVVAVAFVGPVVVPMAGWLRFSAWAGLTLGGLGLRAILLRPVTKIEVLEKDADRWARLFFGSTLVCGLIGASGPLLFFPSLSAVEQMFLTMIFCCWVTAFMTSAGVYTRFYTGYVFIFIVQLILAWLTTDNPHVVAITVMLAIYGAIISRFSLSFAKQVVAGVEIRFQNEELIHELDAARRTAEAANHAKSRLLAVASHDLRQPLHALTILSGLLRRYATSEKVGEVAQQIVRSVDSLERLFSSLLDLSRLDVGAMQPELRPVSLRAIVDQLSVEFRPRAGAKGLRFEASGCEAMIVTDPMLLERILRNLIDNAIKYTERGRVELACEQRSDALVVRVADTGPGIRPEDREAIFKEFYQASGGKHRETGLGLGLAIVKRLTELLEYTIETESEVGVGTAFRLVIPRRFISAGASESGTEPREGTGVALEGFCIVYVDDDVQVHAAMSLLFREWGCEAVIASTLAQAQTQLRERGIRPEAVLSDYSLTGNATGFAVIEALRQEYGALPAAIITGETGPRAREKLQGSEYPVLLKPVQPDELRRLLEVFRSVG
jgi:signal transduction histidine kinase/CheY-like chemotaxis protein